MPFFVVIANLFHGEAMGTILLVGKEEQGDTEDLRGRQYGVLCPLPIVSMYGTGRRDYRHTEHFPTLAQSLPVLGVDHKHDGVTIVVVPVPYGAYSALSS